jgi:AraC-like DNA-binding protein
MSEPDEDRFASAAMIRLVAAGLARQGIEGPKRPAGAHVPQTTKRAALERVMAEHGVLAVLRICNAARDMRLEPVVLALRRARDVPDLMDRWQRLERFSHARHRVRITPVEPGAFDLIHHARDDGPPPVAAESLLVLGLLAILAEIVTGGNVTLSAADGGPWRADGTWRAPARDRPVHTARLAAEAECRPDDVVPFSEFTDPIETLRRRILADPTGRWTLPVAARATAMSERTLQRRLAADQSTFSRLVNEVRMEAAASYLCDGEAPGLSEIGFLTGHADQAHFTRSFKRAVGTTPSQYRQEFKGKGFRVVKVHPSGTPG